MRISYIVDQSRGRWRVMRLTEFGPYGSREEAINEALYVARYSTERGMDAEVIVQSGRAKGSDHRRVAPVTDWVLWLKELAKLGAK